MDEKALYIVTWNLIEILKPRNIKVHTCVDGIAMQALVSS